jgi:hypothetical protein
MLWRTLFEAQTRLKAQPSKRKAGLSASLGMTAKKEKSEFLTRQNRRVRNRPPEGGRYVGVLADSRCLRGSAWLGTEWGRDVAAGL